jgi:hypothetical protein
MGWYNQVFVPMALRLGKELRLLPGLIDCRCSASEISSPGCMSRVT